MGGDAGLEVRQTAWKSTRCVASLRGRRSPVADGVAGGLRAGDLLIEFGELPLRELAPVGVAVARRQEGLLLGQREPGVAGSGWRRRS